MHHLQVHPNHKIKGNNAKIRTQKCIQLNTEAKKLIKLRTDGPDQRDDIKPIKVIECDQKYHKRTL